MAAVGREGESPDRTIYNYCAARVARLLHEHPDVREQSLKTPGALHDWRISLAKGDGMVDPGCLE